MEDDRELFEDDSSETYEGELDAGGEKGRRSRGSGKSLVWFMALSA